MEEWAERTWNAVPFHFLVSFFDDAGWGWLHFFRAVRDKTRRSTKGIGEEGRDFSSMVFFRPDR
jgi:hypothetical protein